MMGYHYDSNYIMGVPLRNRKGVTIMEYWKNTCNTFRKSGVDPKTHVLDNEISKDLIESFESELIHIN